MVTGSVQFLAIIFLSSALFGVREASAASGPFVEHFRCYRAIALELDESLPGMMPESNSSIVFFEHMKSPDRVDEFVAFSEGDRGSQVYSFPSPKKSGPRWQIRARAAGDEVDYMARRFREQDLRFNQSVFAERDEKARRGILNFHALGPVRINSLEKLRKAFAACRDVPGQVTIERGRRGSLGELVERTIDQMAEADRKYSDVIRRMNNDGEPLAPQRSTPGAR